MSSFKEAVVPHGRIAVIGMIHFSPLEGMENFEGQEITFDRARQDLSALEQGGVDAIMFENNHDPVKYARLREPSAGHFASLVRILGSECKLPWGVCALWNDYPLALRLCKEFGGRFIRVPVFVDSVQTKYDTFHAEATAVIAMRRELDAEAVALLVDVQVKHSKLVTPRPFAESLEDTLSYGVEGVVVTGDWTGHAPPVELCEAAKTIAGNRAAVLTGSGMTTENAASFLLHIDGCIVGTAFKEGLVDTTRRTGPNLVGASVRYSAEKVKEFVAAVRRAEGIV